MKTRIEILPYPDGFLVILSFNTKKGTKKKADEIRKAVMSDLIVRGHVIKTSEVEWNKCEGVYYFKVVPREERPQLLEDLKQALSKL